MPGGGVCAVLDYEVDMMAEYVAEMAIELVLPQSPVSPSFRKFVSQILSSTRLPRATILLGMNYLSKRVNGLKAIGTFHPIEGQVWRMLTIALLLGSKFLDDNTFQNRSWSEVSGISVAELNKLEAEWLVGIGWNLYVNLERSEDYNAWLDNWSQWMGRKKMAQTLASRERLAALVSPIDTDFARPRNQAYTLWHQQQVAEYERLSSMKRTEQPQQQAGYRPQEIGWNQYSAGPWSSAPLTPPDSGYGTPEYPASATSGNGQFYGDWFNRAFANDAQAQRYSRQNSAHNIYHHGRHSQYSGYYNYGQNIWDNNVAECPCANCTGSLGMKNQHYFMPTAAYGQAVLG
ncbi:cyclin-like protein [Diaporthe australafricana]|uniref:Cyclin-like protein n=1 Tax=Diaporthe australafricana TaxID=127596 RepID=A0ABR3WHF4_9PEZI